MLFILHLLDEDDPNKNDTGLVYTILIRLPALVRSAQQMTPSGSSPLLEHYVIQYDFMFTRLLVWTKRRIVEDPGNPKNLRNTLPSSEKRTHMRCFQQL